MRGPVVQEGERLAEALLTNHQVLPELYSLKQSRGIKFNLGAGEAGGPGGGAGRQAAPPHLGLPHYHGKAWWRGQPQQLFCVQVEFVQVVSHTAPLRDAQT